MLIVGVDPGSANGACAVVRHPLPMGVHPAEIRLHILALYRWHPKGGQTLEDGAMANVTRVVEQVVALPRLPLPERLPDYVAEDVFVRVEAQHERGGADGKPLPPKAMLGPAYCAGAFLTLARPHGLYQVIQAASWRSYYGIRGKGDVLKDQAIAMAKLYLPGQSLNDHEAEALLLALIPYGWKGIPDNGKQHRQSRRIG